MSRDPEFFYTQAERLVSEGKLAAAEVMLRQAAELGGQSQVYLAALGVLLALQEGRGQESLELLQVQLALHPEEPCLLVAQALAAETQGDSDLAELSLRRAVTANPNHAFAHHRLGQILQQNEQWDEAEVHACKAFALVPDQPHYALAAIELLEAAGKEDYAFEVASLGASFCPQDMELVQKAVEGALARQEPERAWEALQESSEDLPWVLGWKATLLEHAGETDKAEILLQRGRERFGLEPDFLILEAAILVRRQLPEQALEVLEQLLSLSPGHRGALRLRADIALGCDSPEEAIAELRALMQLDPEDVETKLQLLATLYQARRYREALDLALAWPPAPPEDPVDSGEDFPPRTPPSVQLYQVLSWAGLGDLSEALEPARQLPAQVLLDCLRQLQAFGGKSSAEVALAQELLELLPESEPQSSALSQPVPAPSPAGVPHPSSLGPQRLWGESLAYEEDEEEDDEEVWVEIDEETGEEYIWIDEDDDEEDDDDDSQRF